MDWLIEVVEEFQFSSDTLYLTKNYIDRYLSVTHRTPIERTRLQLLGVTALMIAA
jgi:cyclin A